MNDKSKLISLNKKAWNKVADKYAKVNYGKFNLLIDLFCNILPVNGLILDLGSGTGLPFAKYFVEKGFNVLGIDIAFQMIKIAQKNVPQAEFRELSMTELNFDEKFDGVFSNYSMLLLNPQLFKDVADRIVKSLKNNGIFYLALNESKQQDVDLEENTITEIMGEKMYSRAYTEKEILEIFKPLGLELLKIYREVVNSKEFGIEHTIAFLFRK